jgi:hypothetical protein
VKVAGGGEIISAWKNNAARQLSMQWGINAKDQKPTEACWLV